ncbi:MAG: flagellin [Solirubrobacterales bacterium]
MADNVTLSSALRSNLLSLQKTGDLVNRTNSRLSTGLKVASAIDDAVAYFQAKGLSDRASDLTVRKDGIDQGISTVKSAITGLEAIEKTLVQMKGVALSAKAATNTERADLTKQFNTLALQLNNLANDASYQGLNLINSTAAKLKVEFSDKSAAVLTINGVNAQIGTLPGTSALGGTSAASNVASVLAGAAWNTVSAAVSKFDAVIKSLDSAVISVRSSTKTLGTNVALLQTRLDFTKQYVNNLKEGSDKLTLADLNEEGANLVSLQTRQQLGIQALSFAGQQEQGVLALFR